MEGIQFSVITDTKHFFANSFSTFSVYMDVSDICSSATFNFGGGSTIARQYDIKVKCLID